MGAPVQIRSHTGLRGIAALLVVMYHAQFGTDQYLWVEQATGLFKRSYLMVDMFFILSGFIISHVNQADRAIPLRDPEIRDFLVRRFVRVYPLLLVTLIAFLLFRIAAQILDIGSAMTVWDRHNIVVFFSQLLLVNAWLPFGGGWNAPSWSISAEMAAYLMFPVMVSLHARRARVAYALLIAIPLIFYGQVAWSTGSLDIICGTAPLRCLAGFSLGMLAFYARHHVAALPTVALATLQIVAAIAIVALLAIPTNNVLIMLPMLVLVATCWTDRGPVAKALSRKTLLWLGDRSYSVYLTHVLIGAMLFVPWQYMLRHVAIDPQVARAIYLPFYLAIVLLVSHLTYLRIEIPARRRLTRRWLGHPATPITVAAPAP